MKSATEIRRTPALSTSSLVRAQWLALLTVLLLLAGCTSGHQVSAETVDSGHPPATIGNPPTTDSGSTATGPKATDSPAAGNRTSGAPVRPTYVFPVHSAAVKFGRFHHDYPATDIFASCGSSVHAPVAGQVNQVIRTDDWSAHSNTGATRGGLSISILGVDGVRYYGSHLRSIATSVVPGRRVQAGDLLGQVGNTGDAAGIACHLHFGISPPCGTADWWNRRGVLSPYRFLKAWQAEKNLSPEPAVLAWRTAHGCPRSATVDR